MEPLRRNACVCTFFIRIKVQLNFLLLVGGINNLFLWYTHIINEKR